MNDLARFHQYLKEQVLDGKDVNVIAVEDMADECRIKTSQVYNFLEILQETEGLEYYLFDERFNGQTYTMCEFYINEENDEIQN